MERYDFGTEDEDNSEEDSEKLDKKDKKIESLFDEIFKDKPEKRRDAKPEEPEESLFSAKEIIEADKAPELDAEAPLGHLSQVETEAIAQTQATERLEDIQSASQAEVSADQLAAESFLENVEATGDINASYQETMKELGQPDTEIPTSEILTETAEPVDPETLINDARQVLRVESPIAPPVVNQSESTISAKAKESNQKETIIVNTKPDRLQTGIVDYLVGRRVGRIKEAAHQQEIQKRLSREVKDISLDLASKEEQVRKVALTTQSEKVPEKVIVNKDEKETLAPASLKELALAEVIPSSTKVEAEDDISIKAELPPAWKDNETVSLEGNQKEPEINDTKEVKLEDIELKPEKQEDLIKKARQAELAGLSAHTMKHTELLDVARNIKVDGTSLRQIYESNLVGEKGLRRIVAEYLRGGDYSKALRRELVEREIDFERDPKLRDQASATPVSPAQSKLDSLLEKTGIDWSEPMHTTLPEKTKNQTLAELLKDPKMPNHPMRLVVDALMVILIMSMVAVITYLLVRR